MKIAGIIPARYASSRFPGKPLIHIHGKSMIQRVVEQAQTCRDLTCVIVATDDMRIVQHVREFGGVAVMTSTDLHSGTDRCREALNHLDFLPDAVINIQGDEPFLQPAQIAEVVTVIKRSEVEIATLAIRITDEKTLNDPNRVKVIFSPDGRAIYFSRHPIPFQKNIPREKWIQHFPYFRHLGLYAYKTSVLKETEKMQVSRLEQAESLEQLRWLENGKKIYVAETHIETPSIDTPEDIAIALEYLHRRAQS